MYITLQLTKIDKLWHSYFLHNQDCKQDQFRYFGVIFCLLRPKEGQIFIFDGCVFITFNQY